jgi:hypothetical protein
VSTGSWVLSLTVTEVTLNLAAVVLLSGCGSPQRLSMDAMRNAAYEIPGVGHIRFENGTYDRKANGTPGHPSVHLGLVDLFEYGDLNGDGAEDAVTFLSRSFGGPELYLSLELFLNKNGSPSHTASYVIGDRVAIDSVKIAQQRINLFLITQGPDDAICCPTLHLRRILRLQNGKLLELNEP